MSDPRVMSDFLKCWILYIKTAIIQTLPQNSYGINGNWMGKLNIYGDLGRDP